MDIQAAAQQLIGYLGSNPNLIAQFVEHPYSTTATATGSDERISKQDMSQIVTQVAAQTANQDLGAGDVSSVASALLGQSDGSVHALTSALFGGGAKASASNASANGPSMAQIAAKSALGGLAAQGLASLLTSALGTNAAADAKKGSAQPATPQMPDLSALSKLAEGFLGK